MWRSPWQKLINRSEKIVGYPSSFINIRYLISDELATVATQIRRLVGTQHPLLKTARYLIGDRHGVAQIRGLVVLLVSKAFNHESMSINTKQRSISEIIETAHAAISIHSGILNIDLNDNNSSLAWKNDMQFGNKMSTLCGDYLLASVSQALADLRNTEIVDAISQGIGDSLESAFIDKDIRNESRYRDFIYLSHGSLFSRCCRAAVTLRTDISDGKAESASSTSDEEVAEQWALKWSELYSLCEDVDVVVRQLSSGRVKSKILHPKYTKPGDTDYCRGDLERCRGLLARTRTQLEQHHEHVPRYHSEARGVMGEMAALLYQDAVASIDTCL